MSSQDLKHEIKAWQDRRHSLRLSLIKSDSDEKKFSLRKSIEECDREIEKLESDLQKLNVFSTNNESQDNLSSQEPLYSNDTQDKLIVESASSESINMSQDDLSDSQLLDIKQAQLKRLKDLIDSSGGLSECPTEMIQEIAILRLDIANLEEKVSVDSTTTMEDISKYDIPAPVQFIDRPEERKFIEEALKSSEKWVRTIVIRGMGGTGKTVLAVEVARAVRGIFKKVIWASANDHSITLANLLDIVLRAINYRSDQLNIDEKQEKVSELLRGGRYLLVIDSFERIGDSDVDTFLARNDFYPSKILITTRVIYPQNSTTIELRGLKPEQSERMLREVGKAQGVANEIIQKDTIDKIHNITSGLPIALKLIIGQLSQNIPLKLVLESLKSNKKMEQLVGDDLPIEGLLDHLFGNSWKFLRENDSSACTILMSMTFFAAPAAERAIQIITDTNENRFQSAIKNLIRMSLIQPDRDLTEGNELRFSLHPLTRSFIDTKVDDDRVVKKAIYSSAVNYFMSLMEQLGRPGLEASEYEKLEQDLPNCLAAFEWCSNQRDNRNTSKIVEHLQHFLFEKGFWHTRIQICSSASALDHDSSGNNFEAAWRESFWAGWVFSRQNNYDEAKKWLEKAQESLFKVSSQNVFKILYEAKTLQLNALITHGEAVEVYKRSKKQGSPATNMKAEVNNLFEQANGYHNKARNLFIEYISKNGPRWTFEDPDYAIALVDSNQGDLSVDMGHWKNEVGKEEESYEHYELAQRLYSTVLENANNSSWQNKEALIAFSSANLGHVEIWLGQEKNLEQIRPRFDEALQIARFIGRPHTIAWCYRGYGLIEQRSAQIESSISRKIDKLNEAQTWLRKALDIFERIGRRERVAETRDSLREVELELTQFQSA
ncbi:NB-ARC domain protein [[Leptolyngbya] sp. PCC 7376]|uniref:tetratricopeptide repeat protein n=1 Tax=[Leptolyngbya] sp. PCC 7376 TaxID=111781 RepID=UPI00029EDD49|nr:tetratricopeptide repeat protein [[Leptolyngbya] sp. PCC 7376]AFY40633.1 NB-ARC domain protein [[Leptolyngbya] sp. PCC 7376]